MAFLERHYARRMYVDRAKSYMGWRDEVSPIRRAIVPLTSEETLYQPPPMDVETYPLEGWLGGYRYETSDIGAGAAANADGMWTWTWASRRSGPSQLFYAPHGGALRHVATFSNGNIRYCAAPGMTLVSYENQLYTYAPDDHLLTTQNMVTGDLPSPKGMTKWIDENSLYNECLAIELVGYFSEGQHEGKYAVSFAVINGDVPHAVVISEPFAPGDDIVIRQELFQHQANQWGSIFTGAEFALAYPESSIMLTPSYRWVAV